MQYDYSKLIGEIIAKYKSKLQFADIIGVTYPTLLAKLQSKGSFTQREIELCVEKLGIERKDISAYFFTLKVN